MWIQKLHENWQMRRTDQKEWLSAVVPGSVYHDLLCHHKMDDPFWRDNENEALKLMDYDYSYRLEFDVDENLLQCDEVILHCDGLDTIGTVSLNGELLGSVKNMHRIWEFAVSDCLHNTNNVLEITFLSPTKYIKQEYEKCVADGSCDAMVGFPHIRKAHCMFGWDWGPRLPDAGIWRDICLMGISTARIDSVYITQRHEMDHVRLDFDVDADMVLDKEVCYTVAIVDPDGIETIYPNSPEQILIENPKLWWPNGYGSQPLYQVTVTLLDGDQEIDCWRKRIGLRTMTTSTEKDLYGNEFCHVVNGVKIFAMGADYIPEDNILQRVTPQRTRELLEQCVAANFNAIRVWGGGYYPDDWFYDACDELGLIVWQDFMFACAVYELSEDFEENITAEFIDNIKRLRHHASLGLWCGNNEMEQFVDEGEWVTKHKQAADYIKMYEYIIPKVLKQYDPNTFYWPASPSSGGSFDHPNDPNRGDVHYWQVWHGNKPFSDYRNYYFRYLSEFGFQSFPCEKTVETYTLPEDRNIFSYIMEKHQRNHAANGKIMNYMYQTFLYPTSFGTLLYASQLLQAEAIKYGVEHFRRNRGRCMGAVYWQLNDCWPVASWSSIDYCGRWKALHYYAKRFFAPLAISCCEEGIMTQNSNVNAEPYDVKKSFRLAVENETMQLQKVTVLWQLRNHKAEILAQDQIETEVEALSSLWLDEVSFPDANLYTDYVSYQLVQQEQIISSGTVLFGLPKHFKFVNPELNYRLEKNGTEIVVSAKAYARSVEVQNENQDLLLSDNYFDLNAEEIRLQVLQGDASKLTLRSVFDIH